MRKGVYLFLSILIIATMVMVGCAKPTASKPPIKIGAIVAMTGFAAVCGPGNARGVEFAIDSVGGEIAGREIQLIVEDEASDPTTAVNKAKKLVEQDKVDAIVGPSLMSSADAVAAYLAPLGVPNLTLGPYLKSMAENNPTLFMPDGTCRGKATVTGLFAYEQGWRTAAVLYSDYIYGQELAAGFTEAFTAKGGKIISSQPVPMDAADMAPYISKIGNVDVVAEWLGPPAGFNLPIQMREYGIKAAHLLINGALFNEPELKLVGDVMLGDYAAVPYTPDLNTPVSQKFVQGIQAKYNLIPGMYEAEAYNTTLLYLTALKEIGGDTTPARVGEIMKSIKYESPLGVIQMNGQRLGVGSQYIVQDAKTGDRYYWKFVKEYPNISPE
jgi:branched-chain amino acid transport system substrate-binding protein